MKAAITVEGLTKIYLQAGGWRRLMKRTPFTAVQDVSFSVPPGELFGLLGPNGAGKTTLVKMLSTLVIPTRGQANIGGFTLAQPAKIRAAVGLVVSDERSFYWRLSGRENLNFFAALHNLHGAERQTRINQVLAEVDLLDVAERRFGTYSTGMKQRIAIARSLLHQPQILFLDEPSRSLDPVATNSLHELLLQLIDTLGVTIFLITHDLSEAEKLCDRVAVMHKGRIQTIGNPAMLRRQLRPQIQYALRTEPVPPATMAQLKAISPQLSYVTRGQEQELHFNAFSKDGHLTAIIDCLRQAQLPIIQIEEQSPTLEEVFTHFTQMEIPTS